MYKAKCKSFLKRDIIQTNLRIYHGFWYYRKSIVSLLVAVCKRYLCATSIHRMFFLFKEKRRNMDMDFHVPPPKLPLLKN